MSMGFCLVCEHCDPKRTNDLGQVRCKRWSAYVSTHHKCDEYTDKEKSAGLFEILLKARSDNNA